MAIGALGVPGACGAGGPHNFPPPQNRGQRKSTAQFLLPELVALVPQPFHVPKATEILKVLSSGCSWTRSLRAVFLVGWQGAHSTAFRIKAKGVVGAHLCVCVCGGALKLSLAPPLLFFAPGGSSSLLLDLQSF